MAETSVMMVVRDQVNQKIESNSRLLVPYFLPVFVVRDQVNQKIESNSRLCIVLEHLKIGRQRPS